jgi:DNA-binding MarR family transcriptional regulator
MPKVAKHGSDLDLSAFLCFAIYSANGAFSRAYKPILDRIGLTYPQYLVMVSIWSKDGQTVGEIGKQLFLETSTVTPLLKRLEAAGLVNRVRDRQDERQVRITLTDQGRALKTKAKKVPAEIAAAGVISPEQAMTLRSALAILRDGLNAHAGD